MRRAVRLLDKVKRSREKCQDILAKLEMLQRSLVHDMYGCWTSYCSYCTSCTSCTPLCRTATHICWCWREPTTQGPTQVPTLFNCN